MNPKKYYYSELLLSMHTFNISLHTFLLCRFISFFVCFRW